VDCVNHEGVEGNWYCERCELYFCDDCQEIQSFYCCAKINLCPKCKAALIEINESAEISGR